MEEYIKNLLEGTEPWRVEMFISKMKDLQKDAVINQVGEFAITARHTAEQILREMKPTG